MFGRGKHLRWELFVSILLAIPMFFGGIHWGLPSRAADRFLYGPRAPWSGQKLYELAGGWPAPQDASAHGLGADVAQHPLGDRSVPVVVNGDDVARARVLIRYRLYTYQPDEGSTLRALSRIKPGHGPMGGMDPGLYQYGGLWLYPVGVMLRVAGALKLLTLRSDVAFYLDHPEAIGRFYLVARVYSALWGLAGVCIVFALVRRICDGKTAPAWVASALFALLPVVVNGAHEAKPHLAGTVLVLLAALAGSIYVERGTRRAAIVAGATCGAAVGMVLSAGVALAILPGMVLLRPDALGVRLRRFATALVAAFLTYALTNPYVLLNFVVNRALLRSNLGASTAMYHAGVSSSSVVNAFRLLMEGASPLLAIVGVVGAVALGWRAIGDRKSTEAASVRRRSTGLLLALPALWVGIQFICFAGGKPGEYGRFAMPLDVFLMIEAVVAVQTFVVGVTLRRACAGILLVSTGIFGFGYVRGFVADSRGVTPRLQWAQRIESQRLAGAKSLMIEAEPHPYCLPPANVFDWPIVLLPRADGPPPEVGQGDCEIRPVDSCPDATPGESLYSTTISWAAKWFVLTGPGSQRRCGR